MDSTGRERETLLEFAAGCAISTMLVSISGMFSTEPLMFRGREHHIQYFLELLSEPDADSTLPNLA